MPSSAPGKRDRARSRLDGSPGSQGRRGPDTSADRRRRSRRRELSLDGVGRDRRPSAGADRKRDRGSPCG